MTDFLKKYLSQERWETYQNLANKRNCSAEELYSINLSYSKELYVILAGLEIVIRNSFHQELKTYFRDENWILNFKEFRNDHLKQIDSAKGNLGKRSKECSISNLISELGFSFWVHLTDAPYEQEFVHALKYSFKNKKTSPARKEINYKLINLLKLRNRIAHLEPIVHDENKLLQSYQDAYDIMFWISPETAKWFDRNNSFSEMQKEFKKLKCLSNL